MTFSMISRAIIRPAAVLRNAALACVLLAGCADEGSRAPIQPPPPPPAARVAPSAPTSIVAPPAPSALRPSPATPPVIMTPGVSPTAPADPSGLVRVGLLVPLSGPSAAIGQGLLNAAQLALFDAADERFVLQIYDTQGTPEGAAAAASAAASHGVRLLLGPLFAAEARAVAPQAAAAGIEVVSFSTDPSIAGGRIHVMGFLVSEQVRETLEHARANGFSRIAVLAPNTIYGQTVVDTLRARVPASGAELTRIEYYDPSGSDLDDVVRRLANYDERRAALDAQKAELAAKGDEVSQLALKRLERLDTTGDVDFDAIFLPEQGARLAQAASLLRLYDVEPGRVQLLGTMLWNTPGLGREPAMIGALFPAPDPTSARDFTQRYRQTYGAAPPPLASHGYDATALAVVLARNAVPGETTNPFAADALTNPSGFAGVDGIFRLTPDGLSQRGFAVMQITRSGAEVVRPAPTSFVIVPQS